jgi:uncharacterized membrane protein
MVSGTWKRDFASGLVVLLPLLVSIWVLAWIYGGISSTTIVPAISAETLRPFGLPTKDWFVNLVRVVVTLVIFVLLVFSIGYLMRTTVGDTFEAALDDVMNQVPGLRVIYNASKVAVETALQGTEELNRPVKVEIWNGMRLTAFKTGKRTEDGREVVFMPTAPNITSGFVLEVKQEDIIETGEPVEEALTRVLSAGFGDVQAEGLHISDVIGEEAEEGPGDEGVAADADS